MFNRGFILCGLLLFFSSPLALRGESGDDLDHGKEFTEFRQLGDAQLHCSKGYRVLLKGNSLSAIAYFIKALDSDENCAAARVGLLDIEVFGEARPPKWADEKLYWFKKKFDKSKYIFPLYDWGQKLRDSSDMVLVKSAWELRQMAGLALNSAQRRAEEGDLGQALKITEELLARDPTYVDAKRLRLVFLEKQERLRVLGEQLKKFMGEK